MQNEILELKLKNPISFGEIDQFSQKLLQAVPCDFLIIDTGEHDFQSVEAIKYFRQQFEVLESRLSTFKKIALVRPPEYTNKSTNPKVYDYFDSKTEAIDWFLE